MVAVMAHEQATRAASVLIVDDHALLADGLAGAFRSAGLAARVCSGPTAEDLVTAAREQRPDVVLLDLAMGGEIGTTVPLIARLRDGGPIVIVLSGSTDRALLGSCLEAGAVGVVSKAQAFEAVLERLQDALAGRSPMAPGEREELLAALRRERAAERARQAPFGRLTPRESAVLVALMDGSCAEDIAAAAVVSLATVRSQIRSILEKLGVHSQLAAVAIAHQAGWQPD
jgi:DNA-binding NarL/FixJ family response regulator